MKVTSVHYHTDKRNILLNFINQLSKKQNWIFDMNLAK